MTEEAVFGWIDRVEPSPELAQQLDGASEVDRAILYAEHGMWYDAVATLAALRRSRPEDTEIDSLWQDLLSQVGLESLTAASFVSLPETNDRDSI